jgi:hypothetical protein
MNETQPPMTLGTLQDDLNVIIAHAETACLYAEVTHNNQILTSSLIDLKQDLHNLAERLGQCQEATPIAPSVSSEDRDNG